MTGQSDRIALDLKAISQKKVESKITIDKARLQGDGGRIESRCISENLRQSKW